MTARWEPDTLLRIRGNAQYGEIQCPGTNRGPKRRGERCGYQKWRDDVDNIAVQDMLPSLARKSLTQVTLQDLTTLAELCLCRDRHGDQKDKIAKKWKQEVDNLAAEEAGLPTCSTTPETKKHLPSMASFGLPTPPSTQTNSQNSSFSAPVDPPSPQPVRKLFNDIKQDFDAIRPEDKALKAAESQLTGRLREESAAREKAEKKVGDAETKISNLSLEIEDLKIRLAKVELHAETNISNLSLEIKNLKIHLAKVELHAERAKPVLSSEGDEERGGQSWFHRLGQWLGAGSAIRGRRKSRV